MIDGDTIQIVVNLGSLSVILAIAAGVFFYK